MHICLSTHNYKLYLIETACEMTFTLFWTAPVKSVKSGLRLDTKIQKEALQFQI